MHSTLEPLIPDGERILYGSSSVTHRKYKRHLFRVKENIYSGKCSQALKRKLKKYRLRKDGVDDEDVLDVSRTLTVSLRIRSPTKSENIICNIYERPRNYLFKMGRKKQTLKERNETDTTNSIMTSQDNKPTANAFKLLMDGRNKSIGSNSPGKDKMDLLHESVELSEKREAKAKRLLVLQKMAEAKGSTKQKEIEKYQEECIKIKMDKRAERLKALIANGEITKSSSKKQKEISVTLPKEVQELSPKKNQNVIKSLNLIDMFIENDNTDKIPERKPLLKEDEEFLNKLSPSIRKKENMLCYFKKIDKYKESLEEASPEVEDSLIIKVKLKPRKKTKKKLSLKKNLDELPDENCLTTLDIPDANESDKPSNIEESNDKLIENNNTCAINVQDNCEKQEKRKRKHSTSKNKTNNEINVQENLRPKRNARKPVKYNDDVFLTSSDEELRISTPKKKKHIHKVTKSINNSPDTINIITDNDSVENIIQTNKVKKLVKEKQKPLTKLAPIFNPKSQATQEATEAKLKFLQSGVPEQLKKKLVQQKSTDSISNDFAIVTHVQQFERSSYKDASSVKDFCTYKYYDSDMCDEIIYPDVPINSFLNTNIKDISIKPTLPAGNIKTVLQNLKMLYPKFPVYRTYHTLKNKSKGNIDSNITDLDNSVEILNHLPDLKTDSPDKLMWSDKYRPLSSKQIIGNFETVRELKRWLETWTEYQDKKISSKNNSDSSDFCASDTDSRDSIRSSKNLLIITGPVGSGKTSAVYAVAAELAIKVIEVNASSRRTGKIMLQDLQEATQSHKVNRHKSSQENSQKSQEIESVPAQPKKRGRKKKVENINQKAVIPSLSQEQGSSQDSARTCMSLILIDDADVVFEQDDGFCSAISQLVHSSKRPVILITGSLLCPHLQKFVQSGRILKTNPFIPRMLGTWLDIMCLADTTKCTPGMGNKLLDFYKGDIRRTINHLQFYMYTEVIEGSDSQNSDSYKPQLDEENSNMSWIDVDQDIQNTEINESNQIPGLNQIRAQGSQSIFDMWWNIPKIIISDINQSTNTQCISNLDAIANTMDTFSSLDYFSKTQSYKDITSNPWYTSECDSVVELENSDNYDVVNDINKDICQYTANKLIQQLEIGFGCKTHTEIESPLMSEQRQKDRLVTRHSTLTSFLNPSNALDRKSLALDYWSVCRTICRIEKSKADSNLRRNNRFCHYLKTSNLLCKSESFDHLCNSLKSFHKS